MIQTSTFVAEIILFALGVVCALGAVFIGYAKEVSDVDPSNVGSEE